MAAIRFLYTSFPSVLEHLETLPDVRGKIKYLLTVKAEARQSVRSGQMGPMLSFVRKCDAEIEKLQQLSALERPGESPDVIIGEWNPRHRGLTRQLAMMLLDDLFPNVKDASNTAKAEFLELLTGFDAAGLRNIWSDYRYRDPISLAQDKELVEKWKKKLKIK